MNITLLETLTVSFYVTFFLISLMYTHNFLQFAVGRDRHILGGVSVTAGVASNIFTHSVCKYVTYASNGLGTFCYSYYVWRTFYYIIKLQ